MLNYTATKKTTINNLYQRRLRLLGPYSMYNLIFTLLIVYLAIALTSNLYIVLASLVLVLLSPFLKYSAIREFSIKLMINLNLIPNELFITMCDREVIEG